MSLPLGATEEDVERFLAVLPDAVAGVREKLGAQAPVTVVEENTLVVDALGKRCPIPVIELAKVIGDVPIGATIRVLSDDEAARLDIPAWCDMRDQEYIGEEEGPAYLIRRLT